jgi:hypothetical protein
LCILTKKPPFLLQKASDSAQVNLSVAMSGLVA